MSPMREATNVFGSGTYVDKGLATPSIKRSFFVASSLKTAYKQNIENLQ